jgi:hypothetical protein
MLAENIGNCRRRQYQQSDKYFSVKVSIGQYRRKYGQPSRRESCNRQLGG